MMLLYTILNLNQKSAEGMKNAAMTGHAFLPKDGVMVDMIAMINRMRKTAVSLSDTVVWSCY